MSGRRVRQFVLGLYPSWWRECYGDEVEVCSSDLVEGGGSPWRINVGLVWGAVRTRVSAGGMPATPELWTARARACLILATAPVLVVVPYFLTLHQVLRARSNPEDLSAHIGVDAYLIMILCAAVLVITALWGYGSLTAGLESGSGRSRVPALLTRAPGRLTLLAVALFIASVVVGPHQYSMSTGHPAVPLDGSPDLSMALRLAAGAALLAGWGMVVPVLVAAVRRGAFSPWLWRSGRRVSLTITVLLWVMAVTATVDAISFQRLAAMHQFGFTFTVLGGSAWLLVAVLGAAAVLSSCATNALTRSLRRGRSLTATV